MGSSLKHLAVKCAPLMRALCEIHCLLLEMRARTLHVDFTRMRPHDACIFQGMCEIHLPFVSNVRTQFACRCHAHAHAGCMQMSRAARNSYVVLLGMCASSLHYNFTRMRTHDVRRFHVLCEIHLRLREVCARSLHADFKRCWRFSGFYGRCAHAVCTTLCGCARKAYACTRGPEHEA